MVLISRGRGGGYAIGGSPSTLVLLGNEGGGRWNIGVTELLDLLIIVMLSQEEYSFPTGTADCLDGDNASHGGFIHAGINCLNLKSLFS